MKCPLSISFYSHVQKDIHKKCAEVLQTFNATTYKSDYSWIDNMKPVLEKDVLKKLDKRLQSNIKKLRKGKNSDLHMAPPEIVNYTEGTALHYNGFGSHGTEFQSLSITDYVNELKRRKFKGKIAEIKKSHRVFAMSKGGKFTERWKIYDCFVFETKLTIDKEKGFYVLFAGDWFKVEKKFKARIDKAFDDLSKLNLVGTTKCKNEEELIDDLDKNRADLLKLDRVMVRPEGEGRLSIEACDFFSTKRCFIHLKDGGSSGAISHLWSQGVVSAEMFVGDKAFRKDLRAKVKKRGPGFESELPKANIIPDRQTYTIVYGIMRRPNKKSGKMDLPFFSKVSLQAATTRLATLGLPVAIELIAKP